MKNLEVKAKCISLELTIQNLVKLGAKHEKKMYQIDTYFNVPEGRLKLREEGLDFASLIYYHRCDTAESCYSDYHICQIHENFLLFFYLYHIALFITVIALFLTS